MKTYLILEDYGPRGLAWREVPPSYSRELLIEDLLGGHIRPARIIELHDCPLRCIDVSTAIARELVREAMLRERSLPECVREFVDRHYLEQAA